MSRERCSTNKVYYATSRISFSVFVLFVVTAVGIRALFLHVIFPV
uniref:Uncharacterized protein n=1 Tax=Anguilla anguilla TaxID=7936 RepID=A0A0E9TM46_ANGAN